MIKFNKPFVSGKELEYISNVVKWNNFSGNGTYTHKCHEFFAHKYGFTKCLLTSSCTDALEMAAILCDVKEGDEVIIPSYTFVSTALAFVRQGAKIVFADSCSDNPNIDPEKIEALITEKTKVIVPVHYAGISCDMDKICSVAKKHNLLVVEDAAQAIDSYYKERPLGSIGDFSCFSFHESKNIVCGEGGMLVVNNAKYTKRSEIIWEKGTNRAEFFRGETDKYSWVDVGSSFLMSDILAAFLFAQLENIDEIQKRRKEIWDYYYSELRHLSGKGFFKLPDVPEYASGNGHIFYVVCESVEIRRLMIAYLKEKGVQAFSHYLSLHKSPYYSNRYDGGELPNSDMFTDCLLRLPIYPDLSLKEVDSVVRNIGLFFNKNRC